MENAIEQASGTEFLQAVLVGGPGSIPAASRVQTISALDEKIKVPYFGGYEHFERSVKPDDDGSSQQIIFRWTMRTEVAE